jgi:hypothetical protein
MYIFFKKTKLINAILLVKTIIAEAINVYEWRSS